jgi:Holliday junction DNA helicase RuvB
LRRARDFAQIKSDGVINVEVAKSSLTRLGIDDQGLDDMDRRILTALVEKFNGGPVGLESLGVAISEDARTIEEVYEPYLIKEGFIQRTSRGRKALAKTFTYLDVEKPDENDQVKLF